MYLYVPLNWVLLPKAWCPCLSSTLRSNVVPVGGLCPRLDGRYLVVGSFGERWLAGKGTCFCNDRGCWATPFCEQVKPLPSWEGGARRL